VTCLEVRELLPEMSIRVLPEVERERLGRHLQWCAGCRKEAGDLDQAAATLAFALPPASPPESLEDRVVASVRRAAGSPATKRRMRTVAASVVAAAIAFASLGWGAVMAGRADRFADRAAQAEREQAVAIEHFQTVLSQVIPTDRVTDSETHLGQLAPTGGGAGGGFALQLVSPDYLDFVMVIVNGVQDADHLPFRVELLDKAGQELRAGRIAALDGNGHAEVYHQFKTQDLAGYAKVRVVDSAGDVVLSGTVDQGA